MIYVIKKKVKIRIRYNRVPNLTQDNTWESDYNTRKHLKQESKEASPFPAGGHKAALDRQDSIKDTNINNKKGSIKETSPLNVSKKCSNQRTDKSLSPRARKAIAFLHGLKYWV